MIFETVEAYDQCQAKFNVNYFAPLERTLGPIILGKYANGVAVALSPGTFSVNVAVFACNSTSGEPDTSPLYVGTSANVVYSGAESLTITIVAVQTDLLTDGVVSSEAEYAPIIISFVVQPRNVKLGGEVTFSTSGLDVNSDDFIKRTQMNVFTAGCSVGADGTLDECAERAVKTEFCVGNKPEDNAACAGSDTRSVCEAFTPAPQPTSTVTPAPQPTSTACMTNDNLRPAIVECLAEDPVNGNCTDSEYGPIKDWCVRDVTDFSFAFNDYEGADGYDSWYSDSDKFMAREFNGDITSWDTSSGTSFERMFFDVAAFNQPIAE